MGVRLTGPGRNAENPEMEGVQTDMDGTLIGTEKRLYEGWIETVGKYGHDFKKKFSYSKIIGRPDLDCAAIVAEFFKIDRSPEELYAEYKRMTHELIVAHGVPLMPGVHAFIEAVKATGLPFSLVTSAVREHVDLTLGPHGLIPEFDVIVTADTPGLKARKPAGDPYILGAQLLGVNPRRCCVTEDSPAGVQAGINAGCFTFGIPHDLSVAAGLAHAHTVLWDIGCWLPEKVQFNRML